MKISVLIFLAYFAFLREENDLDIKLGRPLFEIMPDLELPMIEADIQRLKRAGVDTTDLQAKVVELRKIVQPRDY